MTSWRATTLTVAAACAAPSACGTELAQTAERRGETGHADGGPARRDAGACLPLAERVRVTEVDAGGEVAPGDEYHPVVVAPRAEGGTLVAWKTASTDTVRVASLDRDDAPEPRPFLTFAGTEVHAILSHADGGGALVILADDPDVYSPKYCFGPDSPDVPDHCSKADLVRFDGAGHTVFRTTLTGKANVDSPGARFVWWYQHTARLVFGGGTYGVYYRSARSDPRPDAPGDVDIFAGDTLRFVGESGGVVDGAGWDWGCSTSWSVRLAYDGVFGAACHGAGLPEALEVAILGPSADPAPVRTRFLEGTEPTRRALGGLVASEHAFWLDYVGEAGGELELRLARIGDDGTVTRDDVVDTGAPLDSNYPFRAQLSAYGAGRLLFGFRSGGALFLGVADAANGAILEPPVRVEAPLDDFVEFTAAPNGDVVWGYSAGGTTVTVVRVAAPGSACP